MERKTALSLKCLVGGIVGVVASSVESHAFDVVVVRSTHSLYLFLLRHA